MWINKYICIVIHLENTPLNYVKQKSIPKARLHWYLTRDRINLLSYFLASSFACLGSVLSNWCFYIHINVWIGWNIHNSSYALCNLTCSFIFFVLLCVDFEPSSDGKKKIFIAVGAVAVALVLFLILGILWWKVCFGGRISREQGGVKLLHKLNLSIFLTGMLAII